MDYIPLTETRKTPSKCSSSRIYSVRLLVAFLSLLGTAIMYITRVNLNVAILAMVSNQIPSTTSSTEISRQIDTSSCPSSALSSSNQSGVISDMPEGEFDWSPPIQGHILGSFFYGYIATQIVGGRLSEAHSSTSIIFGALSLSGVINLVTPFLVRSSLALFILSRVVLGAAQGLVYPAFYSLFAKWIPAHERGTYLPWLDGGITIGTILISASSGQIIVLFSKFGGWPVVFYFSGVLALVWSIFWLFLVRSDPDDHPFISGEELRLIRRSRECEGSLESAVPNWGSILSSSVFYAVLIAKITYGIVFDFVTLKIPAYLQDVIHMPVDENGFAVSFIMLGYMITLLSGGLLADSMLTRPSADKCRVRKVFQLVSGASMAAPLLLMPYVGCNKWANVLLLTGSMLGYGFTSGGDVPIVADIAGPLSGTVFAIMNTACSVSGFAVPYLVGVVIEAAPGSFLLWSSLINGCALLVVLGTVAFLLGASSHLQSNWWTSTDQTSDGQSPEVALDLTESSHAKMRLHSVTQYDTFTQH